MQEQVNEKTVALTVKSAKFTGQMFERAIVQLWRSMKQEQKPRDSPTVYKGRQTVKQLVGQGAGVQNIEINDASIKKFERIADKYGVDFAIKKDTSEKTPKFLVFFKSRDADALTAALSEYNAKIIKTPKKPSLLSALHKNIELVKNTVVDRAKNKDKNLER